MKKLVVASLLGLAVFTGLSGTAMSGPLLGFNRSLESKIVSAPVTLVQAGGEAVLIQQLQEEIRQLNGRIEEMSFQLLQMQEQLRKTQEDNEFRFQELEKSDSSSGVRSQQQVSDAGTELEQDDIASIIEAPLEGGASSTPTMPRSNTAPAETTLGSIQLDDGGMPIGGTMNSEASNSSALPGVAIPQDPIASSSNMASLTSDNDVYQAAYSLILSGEYRLAEEGFQSYVDRFPQGEKIADASFWLGEAQYSQGRFTEAAKTFLNSHQTYTKSTKAPEMLMKLGMSLAALDNDETACATLKEVPRRYPSAAKAVLTKVAAEQKRLRC